MTTKFDIFKKRLETQKAEAERVRDEFLKDAKNNFHNTLEWGQKAFYAASHIKLCSSLLQSMSEVTESCQSQYLLNLQSEMNTNSLNKFSSLLSRSTSPVANILADNDAVVMAEWAKFLNDLNVHKD